MKWVDEEKGLAYLSSASRYVQQEIDKQDLNSAANIIKDFENPKSGNLFTSLACEEELFRDGYATGSFPGTSGRTARTN